MSKIFPSAEESLLTEKLQAEDDIPFVTLKLTPPIRSKILNYRDTVSNLDIVVDDVSVIYHLVIVNLLRFVILTINTKTLLFSSLTKPVTTWLSSVEVFAPRKS